MSVLLFSGGLDSFIGWRLLGEPTALYVRLGHRYELAETASVEALRARLAVFYSRYLDLRYSKRLHMGDVESPDAHVPFRNLLMLTVAAVEFPTVDTFYFGALAGEGSRDKTRAFVRGASALLSECERPVRIVAPFIRRTKAGLVGEYLKRFPNDAELLRFTRSCYSADILPDGVAGCGACMACFRRWVAMSLNDQREVYLSSPYSFGRQWAHARQAGALWRRLLQTAPEARLGIVWNNWLAWRALRKAERQ